MRRSFFSGFILLALTACDLWSVSHQTNPVLPQIPTQTPGLNTATPVILLPPTFPTQLAVSETPFLGSAFTSTSTGMGSLTPSETITPEIMVATLTSEPIQLVAIEILGCNTSIDISHGMGEVTNAYVTMFNRGNTDLTNFCGLLRALDEDRSHPDKQVCLPVLQSNHKVTLKLTVDSAYQQDTLIQVDAISNDVVLLRVDKPSCTDISLLGGEPADLGVAVPIQP